jgi:hypothetical protein
MLSATKFTIAVKSPTGEALNPDTMEILNMPVCLANMSMAFFGWNNVEREELNLAKICQAMAQIVVVDSEKRTVYIGESLIGPQTSLIEYTDVNGGECSKEFFRRWDETHEMFFEFTLLDGKGDSRFCVRGLWSKGKWAHLGMRGTPTLTGISE